MYGVVRCEGARVGDPVRYVPSPTPGQPGAILKPRHKHEINAILQKVQGTLGYVQLKPQLASATAGAESGSASGVRIELPIGVRGALTVK